ncbi:hypothetical protein V5O48_015302 [Marasmius crinis-equi]|uniref:Uncharacterized protein n=1 Tax=Marasmius crinis-equi TaxID=585013 RepID=A0ABR3EUW8_9AGAR
MNAYKPPTDQVQDGEEDRRQPTKTPAGIHPDKRVFLEALLPTYLALRSRSTNEKSAFWASFSASFLEQFPLAKYPPPKSNLPVLPALSADEKKNMTRREKDSWKKAEKKRSIEPEQRAVEEAKRWLQSRRPQRTPSLIYRCYASLKFFIPYVLFVVVFLVVLAYILRFSLSTTPNNAKEPSHSHGRDRSNSSSPSSPSSLRCSPGPRPASVPPTLTPTRPTTADSLPESSSSGSNNAGNANAEAGAERGVAEAAKDNNEEAKDGDEEERNDDDDEKAISVIHPDKVAFFETLLPTYLALESRSHEKKAFWEAFPSSFLAKFPVEEYPPPECTMKPLPVISDAEWRMMSRRQKDNRKKKEKRRKTTPEQRAVEQAKRWFLYQQTKGGRQQNKMARFFKNYHPGQAPPRKLPIQQFLTSHPEHKDSIASMSTETGDRDRLPCRAKAAKQYVGDLPDEDRKKLVEERDERFKEKRAVWKLQCDTEDLGLEEQAGYRRNLPGILQPILEACSQFTGMAIFLQAGLELDHPDQGNDFDVLSLSAVPDGCPTLDQFGLAEYNDFNMHFLVWLREIERIKLGLSDPMNAVIVPPKTALPSDFDELITMDDEEGKGKRKPRRAKGKKKAKGNAKPKSKRKSLKSKKKDVADDVETAESECDYEFDEESGEEASGEGDKSGAGGGDEEDEEDDELDEESQHPQGPPMSAYEIAREDNMKRIKGIWEGLEGPQAVSQLKESLSQPPRPLPKPKRKSKDPIDIAPSNIVTRSQRNADKAGSPPSQPPPDQLPHSANAAVEKTLSTPLSPPPSADNPLSPSPAVPEVSKLPQAMEGKEMEHVDHSDPHQPMEDVLMTPGTQSFPEYQPGPSPTLPPLPEAALPGSEGQSEPTETFLPPPTTLSIPVPSPVVHSQPTPASPRSLFLKAFQNVTIDFEPTLDKIHPSAYDGKKAELIQKLGGWLFKMPEGSACASRPVLYDAVVCKWMELENLWIELQVQEESTANTFRPVGFQTWFRDGREKRPKGEATPPGVKLEEIRRSWWEWLDENTPEWRTRVDGKVVPGGEGDWEECELPGKCGIVLFVVALKWWHDVGGVEDEDGDWEKAAKTLYCGLDCMLSERRKKCQTLVPATRDSPDTPLLDADDRRKPQNFKNSLDIPYLQRNADRAEYRLRRSTPAPSSQPGKGRASGQLPVNFAKSTADSLACRLCKVFTDTAVFAPIIEYIPKRPKDRLKPHLPATALRQVQRGINHPDIAALFAGRHLHKYVSRPRSSKERKRVISEIQNHKVPLLASDLQWFLYSHYDPANRLNSLFKGHIMFHVGRHIFTCPSSALNRSWRQSNNGNNKALKLSQVNSAMIAYIALQIRYCLSALIRWTETDIDFSFVEFYYFVINTIEGGYLDTPEFVDELEESLEPMEHPEEFTPQQCKQAEQQRMKKTIKREKERHKEWKEELLGTWNWNCLEPRTGGDAYAIGLPSPEVVSDAEDDTTANSSHKRARSEETDSESSDSDSTGSDTNVDPIPSGNKKRCLTRGFSQANATTTRDS